MFLPHLLKCLPDEPAFSFSRSFNRRSTRKLRISEPIASAGHHHDRPVPSRTADTVGDFVVDPSRSILRVIEMRTIDAKVFLATRVVDVICLIVEELRSIFTPNSACR